MSNKRESIDDRLSRLTPSQRAMIQERLRKAAAGRKAPPKEPMGAASPQPEEAELIGRGLCRLPNGLEVAFQSKTETDYFYDEIFRRRCYLRHGLSLPDGACVFDVGANIGMFTLFAHAESANARSFSFEPAPPLFRILEGNVRRHSPRAQVFNFGISDKERSARFTFYPNSSGMSSFHADRDEEKEVLSSIVHSQAEEGAAGMNEVLDHSRHWLDSRLSSETFECRLRPLSDVIRECRVERIDFLKIDVQKSEMSVLRGIADDDWTKIRQIAAEVHDIDGGMGEFTGLLESKGFKVSSQSERVLEGSVLFNVFAKR